MSIQKKYFIVTIDTEGDNLWEWKEGMPLETRNTKYLPRFQRLCNQYHFIPTWFCNWEMVNDTQFVSFVKENLKNKKCDIGMHLHAWNTPPFYELPRSDGSGLPYLIEYPEVIMRAKIVSMTNLIEEKIGVKPVTHRAGRWGMNDTYFKLLYEQGYIADASITPYVNWHSSVGQTPCFTGPDYSEEKMIISTRNGIMEVPMSIIWSKKQNKSLWLRPNRVNLEEMMYLIDYYKDSSCDYLMFMIHSSELMPGGSPTFKTEGGIEKLYTHLDAIFTKISKYYEGIGFEQYVRIHECQ